MPKIAHFFFRPLIAGSLVALPLIMTLFLVIWLVRFGWELIGPRSAFGLMLDAIGSWVGLPEFLGYVIGFALLLAFVYGLGLLTLAGFEEHLVDWVGSIFKRIPVLGDVYDLASRFVAMLDRKKQTDLKTMSPVWCSFGGGHGTTVLALLPTPTPIMLEGKPYHAVLVPTAPVPFGGGLLYVPVEWVRPADFGVDGLASIYVSMGVVTPPTHPDMAKAKGVPILPGPESSGKSGLI